MATSSPLLMGIFSLIAFGVVVFLVFAIAYRAIRMGVRDGVLEALKRRDEEAQQNELEKESLEKALSE